MKEKIETDNEFYLKDYTICCSRIQEAAKDGLNTVQCKELHEKYENVLRKKGLYFKKNQKGKGNILDSWR